MSCFSCGENFNQNTNALLRAFKEQYLKYGIVRYYYRISLTEPIKICTQSSFNIIYKNEIKPNLINGAEYSHISEYK